MGATKHIIETDDFAIKKQIIASGVFIFSVCIVTTILFRTLFNYSNAIESITLIILWVSMTILWATASILAWLTRNKNKYILTDESLVVEQKGLLGSDEKYFRYDSMLSLEVKQSSFSKNSGKIVITIPKMDAPLVLEYVKNPKLEAENIKQKINFKSTDTKSLIN